MLRSIPLSLLLGLAACATTASEPPVARFVPADPGKFKSETESTRAQQLAETACKAKALTASAEIEKTIAGERRSMESVDRARQKGAEMYTTSYSLCMMSSGFVKL